MHDKPFELKRFNIYGWYFPMEVGAMKYTLKGISKGVGARGCSLPSFFSITFAYCTQGFFKRAFLQKICNFEKLHILNEETVQFKETLSNDESM